MARLLRGDEIVHAHVARQAPAETQGIVGYALAVDDPEPRRAQAEGEFVRRHELLPAMGSGLEPAQHVFRADDREREAP